MKQNLSCVDFWFSKVFSPTKLLFRYRSEMKFFVLNGIDIEDKAFSFIPAKTCSQDDYMEALTRLHITVSKAYKVNPEMNFEVFIHKVDGLSDDHKIETQRDIHQRANDDLTDAGLEKLHLRWVLYSCKCDFAVACMCTDYWLWHEVVDWNKVLLISQNYRMLCCIWPSLPYLSQVASHQMPLRLLHKLTFIISDPLPAFILCVKPNSCRWPGGVGREHGCWHCLLLALQHSWLPKLRLIPDFWPAL